MYLKKCDILHFVYLYDTTLLLVVSINNRGRMAY